MVFYVLSGNYYKISYFVHLAREHHNTIAPDQIHCFAIVNADLFLHNSAGMKMHNCAEEKCTILPANNAQSYRYKLHKNQPLLI